MTQEQYVSDAVQLLKKLIATPSVSRNEKDAADIMEQTIRSYGFEPQREANNLWIIDPHYDESRPTLLLNAHIDTVKPVASWSRDPFSPDVEDGVLYGLGSNDCGGGLCSLLQIFRMLTEKPQSYNLIYLASAEEEVSGKDGITRALPLLPHIDLAIVGEPTGMNPAVAEKGLMVLDVIAHGKSGHAARNEGVNAIYEALDDMRWIRDYKFEKVSEFLGPTKMTLTVVNAGTQHNVIPDKCTMLVDIRTNEFYDNEEVYEFIRQHKERVYLPAPEERGKGTQFPPEVITYRPGASSYQEMCSYGYEAIRKSYPQRPGIDAFPILQAGAGRIFPLPFCQRVYPHQRNTRCHCKIRNPLRWRCHLRGFPLSVYTVNLDISCILSSQPSLRIEFCRLLAKLEL